MPYRRKDSRFWWISYPDPTRRSGTAQESSGTTSLREAKRIERKKRAEAGERKSESGRLYDEIIDYYLDHHEAKASHWRDLYAADRLSEAFSGVAVATIKGADIASYKASRAVSDATVNKELFLLSAAIRYWNDQHDENLPNPVKGRTYGQGQGRIRWATRKEIDALKAAAPRAGWFADFVELSVQTGLRRGELLALDWFRVDLANELIYLEPEHQKNRTRASVPMTKKAKAILKRRRKLKDAKVIPVDYVTKTFNRACVKAGLDDFHVHDLRHTFAAWLVQKGVPMRTVAELLRHKDIRMTLRYAHLAPTSTRDALKSVVL